MKRSLTIAAALVLVLQWGCKKETSADPQPTSGLVSSAAKHTSQDGTEFTTVNFAAVANVKACLGYNIRFSGPIEIKTHQVVKDGVVETYVRQWSIKGLSATSWSTTNPANGTPAMDNGQVKNYVVRAGTEMFAVQNPARFSSIGMPTNPLLTSIFIHQGTIVLENTSDPSEKLVVRHQIVKTPNSTSNASMPRSGWYINGKHCGM